MQYIQIHTRHANQSNLKSTQSSSAYIQAQIAQLNVASQSPVHRAARSSIVRIGCSRRIAPLRGPSTSYYANFASAFHRITPTTQGRAEGSADFYGIKPRLFLRVLHGKAPLLSKRGIHFHVQFISKLHA